MKLIYLTAVYRLSFFGVAKAQYSVLSPHSMVEARVEIGDQISYSVHFNGKQVISNSVIRFEFRQAPPRGEDMVVLNTSAKEINET